MQNALYFENSHVRPVPLLIGVKKKIPATENHKKKISCTAFTLKKKNKQISALSVSGKKKSFQGEIFQPPPPPPQKSNGSPLSLHGGEKRPCELSIF